MKPPSLSGVRIIFPSLLLRIFEQPLFYPIHVLHVKDDDTCDEGLLVAKGMSLSTLLIHCTWPYTKTVLLIQKTG